MGSYKNKETAAIVRQIGRWVRTSKSFSKREKVSMASIDAFVMLVLLKVFVKDHAHLSFAAQASHAVGLSLKTQELTTIYLAVRLISSISTRGQIHVLLDSLALLAILWVINMMRFELKSSYMQDLDNMPLLYVMVEPFTANYVFALGVTRFMGCTNWIIQLIDTRGAYLVVKGKGHFWILLARVSEVVQTFILADFCYYYVKS